GTADIGRVGRDRALIEVERLRDAAVIALDPSEIDEYGRASWVDREQLAENTLRSGEIALLEQFIGRLEAPPEHRDRRILGELRIEREGACEKSPGGLFVAVPPLGFAQTIKRPGGIRLFFEDDEIGPFRLEEMALSPQPVG